MVKHIVFLRNPEEAPTWGGLEKLMLDWFKRIDTKECSVTLAVSSHWVGFFRDKFKEKEILIQVLALPYEHKQGGIFVRFIKLFRFLRRLKPTTIIFVQGWFFSFNLAEVLAGFLSFPGKVYMHENLGPPMPSPKVSKKYLGFFNGVGLWWYLQIYSANLRAFLSNKIIVVSKEIKENLVSFWFYPSNKILVKYHGVEIETFKPDQEIRQQMRASLNIPSDEIVMIVASRLSKEKCVERTIQAFDTLSQKYPHLTLLILGEGILLEELKGLALSLPSAKKILFEGYVKNVGDFYKMSDIYVLSSDKEGFGIALIEAMASGLICVATQCTGPNEIIQDGNTGFLVPKTTQGVLEGMKKALELSGTAKVRMQGSALKFVSENCEINERIKDVFNALEIKELVNV